MRKAALLFLLVSTCVFAQPSDKPKVRAITAFVRITPADADQKIADALKMLRAAKSTYEKHGYEVESIRMTTQPFPEIVKGMSSADALAFLQKFDQTAQKEQFDPNIGPAMLHDGDATASIDLLKQVLTTTKTLEASVIVADTDGIHWNAIRATAGLV